jgi:hypothetical protein
MNTQGFTAVVLAVEVRPVSYRMARETARCGRVRGAALPGVRADSVRRRKRLNLTLTMERAQLCR